MPKETINPRHHGTSDTPLPFAEVAWGRDGGLELVVRKGGDYDEATTPRPSLRVELDRAGVNRMIRALRKGRDQAFGADA